MARADTKSRSDMEVLGRPGRMFPSVEREVPEFHGVVGVHKTPQQLHDELRGHSGMKSRVSKAFEKLRSICRF